MKLLTAVTLLTLGILFLDKYVFANKFQVKISMPDCQPSGIIYSWQERLNSKEFWITQNVVFEKSIAQYELSNEISWCNDIKDLPEKMNCKLRVKNLFI